MQSKNVNSIVVTKPDKTLKGSVRLPASKSISNRLLMIRALSGTPFNIGNLSESDDTQLLNNLIEKAILAQVHPKPAELDAGIDRKSTRLNSSH